MHIKDKLQHLNLEKRYEGYCLEDDGIPIYKNKMYIPNVMYLRITITDQIHKMSYSGYLGYQKVIVITRKQYFLLGMKKYIDE